MILDKDETFVPDTSREKTGAKISCHTTGQIHYENGSGRQAAFHIEPLHRLSRAHLVGFFSIPNVSRLEGLDRTLHTHDAEVILDIPAGIEERLNFVLEMAPRLTGFATYGVRLDYEVYAVIVRLVPSLPLVVSKEVSDHFIHGTSTVGSLSQRAMTKQQAELEFLHCAHNHSGLIIFRTPSGQYVAIPPVVMRVAPTLRVTFSRSDLRVDVGDDVDAHKIPFWIMDKGGRNKTEDLRPCITRIELDADL